MTIEEEIAAEAFNAAWDQFQRMPSSNPSDYARAVTRALSPLLDRVRAEARADAIDAVEDHLVRRDCFSERTLDLIDELRPIGQNSEGNET